MSEQHESVAAEPAPTAAEAEAIATLGYIYGYPLVLMDMTRAASTTPANRFNHMGAFPDDTFTDVVSPNVDTLYSAAWLDVGKEPIVLAVPDLGRRYYTLQLLDAWTNVIAAPGTRTTGNGKGAFAIIGPDWSGNVPSSVEAIQSPTSMVWLIGRTYTAGKSDYDAVHAIQRQYQLVPLSAWGRKPTEAAARARAAPPPAASAAPAAAHAAPPVTEVDKLDAETFFARLARLMARNPPASADAPMVQRLARLGISPGAAFDLARLPASVADAIEAGVAAGRARLHGSAAASLGKPVDGWRLSLDLGHYGTNYEHRAAVALIGLGANLAADAVYAGADTDADDRPLSGEHRYVLRFPAGGLPPVKAFWSLTMYDARHFLAANPIGRYALGDRDPMRADPDGALDIVIQHDDPGPERRANWLPAPGGEFNLILRLYYPKPPVLEGSWRPPAIARVG
jgi:hypothetical protein